MAGPSFDPNGAVRFDLRGGSASDAKGGRLVLLPAVALEVLERSHPDAALDVGAELGRACGARVASRLGGDGGVRGAQLESVVSHLAGELAVAGVGAVSLERWGRAMVIVVANPVAGDAFVGAVVAGAVGAAAGRDAAAAALGREGQSVRFFVGTKTTAERVRQEVASGRAFAEVLGGLHGGAA